MTLYRSIYSMFTSTEIYRWLFVKLEIDITFIESTSNFCVTLLKLNSISRGDQQLLLTVSELKRLIEETIVIHTTKVKLVQSDYGTSEDGNERIFHIKADKDLIMFLENQTNNAVGWRYSVQLQAKYVIHNNQVLLSLFRANLTSQRSKMAVLSRQSSSRRLKSSAS